MGFDKKISFRRASLADTKLLFKWANDPETRKNSFHSEPIAYEEHVRWFQKKLSSPDTLILIASLEENSSSSVSDSLSNAIHSMTHAASPAASIDIGLLRLEREDDRLIISYLLDASYRGRGLGFYLLKYGLHYELDNRILSANLNYPVFHADVMLFNTASSKNFQKLGFILTKNSKKHSHVNPNKPYLSQPADSESDPPLCKEYCSYEKPLIAFHKQYYKI